MECPYRSSLYRLINKQGVTLLEVLIAMVLVSLVLLEMAGFSTIAIKGSAFSQKLTTAVTLAQNKLEEIRLAGYRSSLSGSLTTVEPYGSISGASLYTRTVVTHADSPTAGLQTVTVIVAWSSDAHSTSISTLLAE
jgi:type IV pilus assembly protein PilV